MCIEVSLFIQDLNGGKGLLKWVRGVLLAFITPESVNHKRPRLPYGDSERGQSVAF